MTDMQRYALIRSKVTADAWLAPDDEGKWVLAANAEAAIAAAVEAERFAEYNRPFDEASRIWHERGQQTMLAKCIAVLDAHHPRCTEPCDLCAEWSTLREELEALEGKQ